MFEVNIDQQKIDAALSKMKGLPIEIRKKSGVTALRASATVVANAAKANAAKIDNIETPNNIAKNIVVRNSAKRFRRTGDIMMRVGVLGGARDYSKYGEIKTGKSAKANPGGDTFYWRFLEFGTKKMAKKPFMLKALLDNTQKATDVFVKRLNDNIDRYIKRASRNVPTNI